ncbi:hypothetical protein Pelo_16045 [Pelomyxa schiedti]|nr:hypothetical protein Pelo_16045 [Pelomyxa schiedti]
MGPTRCNVAVVAVVFAAMLAGPLVPHAADGWLEALVGSGVVSATGVGVHQLWELLMVPVFGVTCWSLLLLLADTSTSRRAMARHGSHNTAQRFAPGLLAHGIIAAAQGSGMHSSANSIYYALTTDSRAVPSSRALGVVYFQDEVLGHHLLLGGIALMILSLVLADLLGARNHQPTHTRLSHSQWLHTVALDILLLLPLSVAGGIAWFMAAVEGQVVHTVGIPLCLMVIASTALLIRNQRRPCLVARHWCIVSCLSLILMITWGWWFDWHWPEFGVLGFGPFSSWPGKILHHLTQLLQGKSGK